ncbi:uncharacterized protein T26G10.4-like [Ischnura elegans]|uniref:uncharacterized protein T26G10.4-like n=1 Tax=Ischnura elegans TaxID=197161 RepID=UPI001ED8AE9D|nr:uncharacterized protein T26G10.4-like [Ischnura elegans]
MGTAYVKVLAFADDLVLVGESAESLAALLDVAGRAAECCGLTFNPGKCASLHVDWRCTTPQRSRGVQRTPFPICGSPIRSLGVGDSYTYLGAPIGLKVNAAQATALDSILEDLRRLDESDLAPWQKMDAVHVFQTPRLEFPLRIVPVPKKAVHDFDKEMQRTVKKWMCLPTRAAREMISLPRSRGGGGYVPLPARRDALTVVHAFRMLTCPDVCVADVAWHTLRDIISRRTGRTQRTAVLSRESMCDFLNGAADDVVGTGTIAASSHWTRVRAATRQLRRFVDIRWAWSAARAELAIVVQRVTPSREEMTVPASARRRLHGIILAAIGEGFRRSLVAKPDQGKVIAVSSRHPDSNHWVSGGVGIRFCNWHFIHRARLNVLPLNAARRGAARRDTR